MLQNFRYEPQHTSMHENKLFCKCRSSWFSERSCTKHYITFFVVQHIGKYLVKHFFKYCIYKINPNIPFYH